MAEYEFVRLLVDNVRKNRCLFDKKDAFYFNKFKKEKVWEEIGKETGKSSAECKSKWKSLRERFSRELRKQDMLSSSGAPAEVEWELFEELSFLRDAMKPRRTRCNESTESEDTSTSANDSSVPFADGYWDDAIEYCPASSTPLKRKKLELDGLMDQFGNVIQKFGDQLTQPMAIIPATYDYALYLQTLHSLMKDLPAAAKDQFKGEMFARVLQLRSENVKAMY